MKSYFANMWKEHKTFVIFIALMLVFRSALADWNEVPTGSMKPTIIEGDRIFVNKIAYDLRVPFTHIALFKISDPVRGDIIVFDSNASDKRLVKRVVGVPGDIVELKHNELYINGEKLVYKQLSSTTTTLDKLENLSDKAHQIRVRKQGVPSRFASFEPVEVPNGTYLVLGDNRDNSADSRMIGFIPRNEIVGRTKHVVLSFNYNNYYIPRAERFFHKL